MAYFWQLSGPESHFERKWDRGNPNESIANVVMGNFKRMVKSEGGVTLLVGIEDTGASQVLIPESMSYLCESLHKRKFYPYASSEFASVSPIYVETPQRLLALLTERQNLAKNTKAKKERRDISKANGKFCGGPRNLTRAQFERGRTFWQVLTRAPEAASIYGLSHPWWIQSISILSFAFSFWRPDGSGRVSADHLLVTSITEFDIQSQEQKQSWCYRIEEQFGLQNADESDFSISVATETLPQKEVVKRVQDRLSTAIARGPVVLLLHEFGVAEREQLLSLGFDVSKWVNGFGPLIGYNDAEAFPSKKEEREHSSPSTRYFKSKSRSRSPPHTHAASTSGSGRNRYRSPTAKRDVQVKDEKVKLEESLDALSESLTDKNSFYVISIVELYKAVTGKYWERIMPNVVFDMLTRDGRSSERPRIPRNIELDSTHIMQAWLAMVKGPFIDEQMDILSRVSLPSLTQQPGNMPPENSIQIDATTGELQGLHNPQVVTQRRRFVDPFNDSDSESD